MTSYYQRLGVSSRLRDFNPGIYTLDECINFDQTVPLVIAVHPFYLARHELTTDYSTKLFQFLDNHAGPILILEEENELARSVVNAYSVWDVPNRYIALTEPQSPEPNEMSLTELFSFIKKFKSPVDLVGGFLDESPFPLDRGCLGYFAYNLELARIPVNYLPGLFFSRKDLVT
jgi:hypothetical protein